MSLRPPPTDIYPGGHVVLLDPERWWRHVNVDEECLCDRSHLEWTATPLGAGVEVRWGSADHFLCIPAAKFRPHLIPHAHPGIVAETHFASGDIVAFGEILRNSPVAVAHMLAIQKSFFDEGKLAEAQHFVRGLLAREAAVLGVQEALR